MIPKRECTQPQTAYGGHTVLGLSTGVQSRRLTASSGIRRQDYPTLWRNSKFIGQSEIKNAPHLTEPSGDRLQSSGKHGNVCVSTFLAPYKPVGLIVPMKPSPSSNPAATLLQKYAAGERDFSYITLNECILAGAKLPSIVLTGASLKVVNFSTANLSHSDLRQAILNVSRLSGANLSQAQLQQAHLNVANLIRAILVGANLSQASLIRAELLRADLSNANLTRAILQEADLREARLRWANLSGANLSRANLRGSSLLGANLNYVQANSATLEGARLRGASLIAAELRHSNLGAADLSGANLRGANLRWANLSGVNLCEADLTDAKLSGANLTGAQLEGATLANTTFVHADLHRANLRDVYCVGSDLSGATLTGAHLHGAVAYDIETTDLVCEWLDLSPQGDQSQPRYFNTGDDIHTFLNHRPPQVKVVTDMTLTAGAHAALAMIFEQLGKVSSVFSQPPNIELTHRRTTLTFMAEHEMNLPAIAYLATWPFQDGKTIQQTLISLMTQGLEQPEPSFAQTESHRELQTVVELLHKCDLATLRKTADAHPFFAAPLQVTLTNTHGRSLELYQNPRFGIRYLPPADGIFPIEAGFWPAPSLADYWAFLSATGR